MNETEEDNKPDSEQASTEAQSAAAPSADAVKPPTNPFADVVLADSATDEKKENEEQALVKEEPVKEEAVKEETAEEKPAPAKKKKAKAAEKPEKVKEPLNITEGMSWYVVQAFSGYEASVKRSLIERIEREGLSKYFGEILVPTEEVVEIRGGQKRKSERKFFPGYVLVQIDLTDESWHLVKDVPRVLGFIGGTADRPAPITDREADAILQRVQDGVDKPRPKVLFDVGEVVRVTDGPFNDFNGVVEEVNFEKNKLLVAVQIFGRSTPVELEFSQVEKA